MIKSESCGATYTRRITPIFTLCLILVVAAVAMPAGRRRPAPKPAAPAAEVLSQIHVLDNLPAPFALDARSAIMVAAHTGTVLYAYNDHMRMQPASLAKIMTFYLTLEALKAGRIRLDTMVNVSKA